MEVNYKALSVYYMGLKYHNQLYYYYLLGNGATHSEAVAYFVRRALEKVFDSKHCQYVSNCCRIVTFSDVEYAFERCQRARSSGISNPNYDCNILCINDFCCHYIVGGHYSFDEYGQIKDAVQHIDVNQSL